MNPTNIQRMTMVCTKEQITNARENGKRDAELEIGAILRQVQEDLRWERRKMELAEGKLIYYSHAAKVEALQQFLMAVKG